jgi:hypothetical protein
MTELLLALVLTQVAGGPQRPIRLLEEGVTKGYVNSLDCMGTGIACTVVGPAGVIAVSVPAMDLTLPTYTRATVPSCDSTWLSKEIRVHDTSQEDQTWVCELDSLGAYQWAVYSQAPTDTTAALDEGFVPAYVLGYTITPSVVTDGAYTYDTPEVGKPLCTTFYQNVSRGAYRTACIFTIGTTAKWTEVTFRVTQPPDFLTYTRGGTSPCTNCEEAGGQTYDEYGHTVNTAYVPLGVWGHHVSSPNRANPSATTTLKWQAFINDHTVPLNLTQLYNPGRSGTWTFSSSPSTTKDWSTYGGIAGAAPAGITTANYYWVTFGAWMTTYYDEANSYGGALTTRSGIPRNPVISVTRVK